MSKLICRIPAKQIMTIVVLVVMTGCVGTGKKVPVELPAVVESYFKICNPLDGALVLQVFEAGDLMGSAEMDWASTAEGWKIDVSNAAGFNVVSLNQAGEDLNVTGTMAKKFPPFKVNSDGFLVVDGNFVGVKSTEIPCLLKGALPRSWTPSIYRVEGNQDKRMLIRAEDDVRNILIRVKNLGDSKSEEICADVSWRNMLFFKSKMRWCVSGPGLKKGTISGIKQFSIKWVQF